MTSGQAGLRIDDLSVRYAGRRQSALEQVSLSVRAGGITGVAGRTGAGKSTLALAAAGFIPRVVRAAVTGGVRLDGLSVTNGSLAELAGRVGIAFAAPALQLSSSKATVREELAFGLENLAVPQPEMDERIEHVLAQLHITDLAEREPLALSGGEQQRVAIASILVMGTAAIVLDEPAAQLDPGGTSALASLLTDLAEDGRAVLVAEHAAGVLAVAESCLVLEGGRQIAYERPAIALGSSVLGPLGLQPPTLIRLAEAAGLPPRRAFDEQALARELARARPRPPSELARSLAPLELPSVRQVTAEPIEVRGLTHRYPGGVEALRSVDLTILPGEILAIVGQNGSGKTTLVKHLNGLLRPEAGSVLIGGRDIGDQRVSDLAGQIGFVFQNPDDQLFHNRVDNEAAFGPRNLRLARSQVDHLVASALSLVDLTEEAATNPYDLGLSTRKLVALASVLAMEPPMLVLDEPTTGQDGPGVLRVGSIIDAWAHADRTVIAITHDMEFAALHFRRIVVMRSGEIILDGPPEQVFSVANSDLLSSTGLLPPPAARIAARLGLNAAPPDAPSLLRLLAAPSSP
jgi:energy-coupling factor transporter ATP-binding protein EcfA2